MQLMDLAMGRDQVAVVRFDTEGEVVLPLTNDRAMVEAAIHGLTSREGTYMDRGLNAAAAALAGPERNVANLPVVVLLTDGQQSGGPAAALEAAGRIRDAGIVLYALALGTDADAATLIAMAGGTDRYRYAPDTAALAGLYAEVARDIRCAGARLWPARGGERSGSAQWQDRH
jgi:Mg-chelatase subunit ChlD